MDMKRLEKIKRKLKVNSEGVYETALSKQDEEWLIWEVEKVKAYEKAFNDICNTSGKGMFHTFSKEGHQDAVVIAENVLYENEF